MLKSDHGLRIRVLGVVLSCLAPLTVSAQTNISYSGIVGYTTLNVRAKTGSANALSFLALNVHRPVQFSGQVTTNTVNGSGQSVVTFPGSVSSNQFTSNSVRHYLRVTSGANTGLVSEIVANGTNNLTLQDNLSLVLSNGSTTFEVRPYWTLGTAFPSGAGLFGSATATLADALTLIDASGNSMAYFYNTSLSKWVRGGVDSENVIIPPGAGILITRKQNSAISIRITGEVIEDAIQTDVMGGTTTASRLTFVANPFPLASKTLAQSGLYTGNQTTGLVGGVSATLADALTIYDTNGVANSYYYDTTNQRWQRGGSDASSVVIPEGSSFVITRKANRPAFDWYIPSPIVKP